MRASCAPAGRRLPTTSASAPSERSPARSGREPWARVEPRSPVLSEPCKSTLELLSAGARPKIIPTASEMPNAKNRTGRFTPMLSARGRFCRHCRQHQADSQFCQAQAEHSAASARSTLSVINCRTMRARLAPNAARMANSRVLAAERASKRFATFVQAISRTIPTAPNSKRSVPPVSPTIDLLQRYDIDPQVSIRGGIETVQIFLDGGSFRLGPAPCSPRASSGQCRRSRGWCDRYRAEAHPAPATYTHLQSVHKRNPGGRTPMIVKSTPSRITDLPSACGLDANRSFHNRSLIMDGGRCVRLVFRWREITSQDRLYAQGGEEAGGDLHAVQVLRCSGAGQIIIAPVKRGHLFERASIALPILKVRVCDCQAV